VEEASRGGERVISRMYAASPNDTERYYLCNSPSDIVENCIKSSKLWPRVSQYQLTTNMRVHPDEVEFSNWLLNLGDGKLATRDKSPFSGCIKIPAHCVTDSVVKSVFGDDFI